MMCEHILQTILSCINLAVSRMYYYILCVYLESGMHLQDSSEETEPQQDESDEGVI